MKWKVFVTLCSLNLLMMTETNLVYATTGSNSSIKEATVPNAETNTSQLPALQQGDSGTQVKLLQTLLKKAGYSVGVIDGSFGPITLSKVKEFQAANHLSVTGIVDQATWNALSKTSAIPKNLNLTPKSITLNGKNKSNPYGFSYQGATYLPIWYVMNVTRGLGIKTTWDGKSLTFITPSSVAPQFPQTFTYDPLKTDSIYINGTLVEKDNGIVYRDPITHHMTTYMPLWFVIQALKMIGINSTWDGTTWSMQESTFFVYNAQNTLIGTYSTLEQAQQELSNTPGGILKDLYGNVLGNSSTFYTYNSSNAQLGVFASESAAESSLSNQIDGYIKDANGNIVYTASYKTYTNSGMQLGDYATETQAESALNTTPGGYIMHNAQQIYQEPIFFAYSNNNVVLGVFVSQQLAQNALSNSPGGYVKDVNGNTVYTQPANNTPAPPTTPNPPSTPTTPPTTPTTPSTNGTYATVDLRFPAPGNINANTINSYLTSKNSPLSGMGQSFIQAQNLYGVNANYLVSHAIEESGWYWFANSIALNKNNLYGYGAYNRNPGSDAGTFPSENYAILFQAWEVRNNYLNPNASYYVTPTLKGMNVNYATDTQWATNIGLLMGEMSAYANGNLSQYQQYSASEPTVPVPNSTNEPIFQMNGATATIDTGSNSPVLPVFSNPSSSMYPVLIQEPSGSPADGMEKYWVQQMQQALNNNGANLTVDGGFGKSTAKALVQYQKANGLNTVTTSNGMAVCTLATWEKLLGVPSTQTLNNGQQVTVDQMMQGMVGDLVIEWYHIVGYGWVDSEYVKFNNVYKITVPNPNNPSETTVNVYGGANNSQMDTLHLGDYVVSSNPQGSGGYIPIQYVSYNNNNQNTVGQISTSQATLVPVTPPTPY